VSIESDTFIRYLEQFSLLYIYVMFPLLCAMTFCHMFDKYGKGKYRLVGALFLVYTIVIFLWRPFIIHLPLFVIWAYIICGISDVTYYYRIPITIVIYGLMFSLIAPRIFH